MINFIPWLSIQCRTQFQLWSDGANGVYPLSLCSSLIQRVLVQIRCLSEPDVEIKSLTGLTWKQLSRKTHETPTQSIYIRTPASKQEEQLWHLTEITNSWRLLMHITAKPESLQSKRKHSLHSSKLCNVTTISCKHTFWSSAQTLQEGGFANSGMYRIPYCLRAESKLWTNKWSNCILRNLAKCSWIGMTATFFPAM